MEQHHFHRSDPLELRVLSALTAGPLTVGDLAARAGQPESVVDEILQRGLSMEAVSRIDLGSAPAYSLTPKGLEAIGTYQALQSAVDDRGHVDFGAASRIVMEQYDAARDVAVDRAVQEQSTWPVDDASRDRVTSALNDAFARGALTKEQLDDRTGRALTAMTMADLRGAADGVLELPPVMPATTAAGLPLGGAGALHVNPALFKVRWKFLGLVAALVLFGLVVLFSQPLLGLAVIAAGVVVALWILRPLLASGTTQINDR